MIFHLLECAIVRKTERITQIGIYSSLHSSGKHVLDNVQIHTPIHAILKN